MKIYSSAVEKSDEVPFWFNPYSELYELLVKDPDNSKFEKTDTQQVVLIGAFNKSETSDAIPAGPIEPKGQGLQIRNA